MSKDEEAPKMGRPSNYKPEYADQAAKLCKLGATDAELADFFAVSVQTIKNWQARYPDFLSSLKAGKEEADNRVERSLFQRAVGYEYDSQKIFNANGSPLIVPFREKVPPDTTAMIFWLKNRRSDRWRDVHKHEHSHAVDKMSADELREYVRREVEELGVGHAPPPSARGNGSARGKPH